MGNGPIPDSVKAHMATDETVLWSHVSVKPVKLSDAYAQKPWPWWMTALWFCGFALCLYLTHRSNPEVLIEQLPMLGIMIAITLTGMWLMNKTTLGLRTAKALEPYSIYQNLVMTDKQLIAFNFPDKALVIPSAAVTLVETDYENGGPALRIQSPSLGQDIVVVGLANFQTATHQFYANNGLHA